jgi:hypothetical protein
MKTIRIFIAFVFVLVTYLSNAQSKSDKMYDAFSNKDGVTNFSFTKNMTDAFNIDLGDNDEKNVTGDLNEVRFMSYNPKKGDMSGSEFIRRAVKMLPSQYKKYVDEDTEDDNAEIYLLGGKKKFKECHVFITNQDDNQRRFVVSFYGDFTVNDLDGLKKTGRSFSEED